MNKTHFILLLFLLVFASIFGAYMFSQWFYVPAEITIKQPENNHPIRTSSTSATLNADVNFINASKISTPSVVFIKTESQQ